MNLRDLVRWALAAAVLPACLAAQHTWTVDLLNRPGTDFTDIPAAVAAAAVGDIVQVRYVNPNLQLYYGLCSITRALTLQGEGTGPVCVGVLEITGLPAGERVLVQGLRIETSETDLQGQNLPARGVVVQDCMGDVVIQDCAYATPHRLGANTDLRGFRIERCNSVHLHDCTLWQSAFPFLLNDSSVFADGCYFGPYEGDPFGPDSVMHVNNSTVWFVDSTVEGQTPNSYYPVGETAIWNYGSILYVAGQSVVQGGDPVYSYAIAAGSWPAEVHADPRATIYYVSSQLTYIHGPIAAEHWSIDAARTTLQLTTYGFANAAHILAWSMSLGPPVPGPFGTLYLDPSTAQVLDLGVLDATGSRLRSIALPPGLLSDTMIGVQGIELDPNGAWHLSNVITPAIW